MREWLEKWNNVILNSNMQDLWNGTCKCVKLVDNDDTDFLECISEAETLDTYLDNKIYYRDGSIYCILLFEKE